MIENHEHEPEEVVGGEKVSFGQVLRNRQFFALWLATLVSSFGDWLALIALFSLVGFRWKGTPSEVSGFMVAYVIPMALFGTVAGVFVDRWNIKKTMIASDLIRAVLTALFPLAVGFPQIYLLSFAMSFVSTFFLPAQSVAIPRIVRKEELLVANAINAQTTNLNRILGPAAASVLVAWAGEEVCFYINSLSFIFSAAMLALIALPQAKSERQVKIGLHREFMTGLRFIGQNQLILFLIGSMTAAILAIAAFDSLIVIYIRDILHSRSTIFGTILSLVGVTTILGSFLIGKYGQHYSKLHLVVLGIMIFGVSIFILTAFGKVWVTLVCCLLLGIGVSGVLVPSQTLIQTETPPEILGRVTSTSMSLMTIAQLISFLVAGRIAGWIGIQNLYYLVSLALFIVGLWGIVYIRIMKKEDRSQESGVRREESVVRRQMSEDGS
jgi:MFS transporter, DHA3 family, macrolide efflux protein